MIAPERKATTRKDARLDEWVRNNEEGARRMLADLPFGSTAAIRERLPALDSRDRRLLLL